jgi:hypothetical protein
VHALGGQEVLEAVLTEVAKVVLHERCRRLRHEHLSSMAGRGDAGSTMDVDAHVAFVGEERRPRVQTDAHAYRTRRECVRQLGGGRDGGGRRRKCHEEGVALGIDLHSIVTGTCLADDLPMCGERLGIGPRSQFVQELRRPLHVGE